MMFFAPTEFDFAARLMQNWQTILDEWLALPHDEFLAWPETGLYKQGWDVYGLFFMQKQIMENCIFCPRTTALLQEIPGLSTASFSRLAAGGEILPHVGYTDRVLRLHLALRANADCALQVGGQVRRWIPGQCLIFDDTVEHSAWNLGATDRLVLLVDFAKQGWRVDLD